MESGGVHIQRGRTNSSMGVFTLDSVCVIEVNAREYLTSRENKRARAPSVRALGEYK